MGWGKNLIRGGACLLSAELPAVNGPPPCPSWPSPAGVPARSARRVTDQAGRLGPAIDRRGVTTQRAIATVSAGSKDVADTPGGQTLLEIRDKPSKPIPPPTIEPETGWPTRPLIGQIGCLEPSAVDCPGKPHPGFEGSSGRKKSADPPMPRPATSARLPASAEGGRVPCD